jgi:hypothetical protein
MRGYSVSYADQNPSISHKLVPFTRLPQLVLIAATFFAGCQSGTTPYYTLAGLEDKSPETTMKGVSVEGGWEFQFPEAYYIQKVVINYEGTLVRVGAHRRTDGRWEYVKTVEVQGSNQLMMDLNINTDAIRLYPEFSKMGNIKSCQFQIGKGQKVFSVPLEKPPFIK